MYNDESTQLVLGKAGARDLVTGIVTGVDPLQPYARPDLRAQQLWRVAQFPHAGDLIIVSTLYPDEQVAAFEELVGSHGGLGGEQTTAFLLHPSGGRMPETNKSPRMSSPCSIRGAVNSMSARRQFDLRRGSESPKNARTAITARAR